MHHTLQRVAQAGRVLFVVLACFAAAHAQQTTGNVRGIVKDPTGAVVPGAKIVLTEQKTNQSQTAQTTGEGEYTFNNLLPGSYKISVEAQSFKTLTLSDVRVELNQTTDVPAQLEVGLEGETVEVSAAGAELVDTTTTTLSKSFGERQVVEFAQTTVGGSGVNNLALIAPNVSSSGGVGVGSGGSVGGQRPRNNNFMIDGVDNNDKSVTGPQSYISPEEVSEFSLLQNQFSAEFGRSNGGQFITITKSGSNEYHGSGYGFFRNRYLNALDTLQKNAGITRDRSSGDLFMPRLDYFRGGANLGGPLYLPRFGEGGRSTIGGKDKLFFFVSYERLQQGQAASAGNISAPTAAGYALLNSTPGLSATNLAVLNTYVPAAPTNDDGFVTVAGTQIPVGSLAFAFPSFLKQNHAVANVDYVQSAATQHRFRFSLTNFAGITPNNLPALPAFVALTPNKQRLFSYTLLHTFSQSVTNETRIAYRRSEQDFPVPSGLDYPGLDTFPNIDIAELAVNIGPNGNFPQSGVENNYQIVNNLTWLKGNHSLKFGGDFRQIISPQRFVQRERGDYNYSTLDLYLRDISPDRLAERNVGGSTYYGNQKILYAYIQDDWRVRPNVTFNLGLGYSYQQVPLGAKFQAANAIASVPGLIEFTAPREQKKNFAPKVGIAYSPDFNSGLLGRVFGASGKSSIRAGFSLGYDYIFDNLYTLSNPPQAQQTVNVEPEAALPNFLAGGGIGPVAVGGLTDPATARSVTGSFIPDQEVPYSITWTGSFQRQFFNDWSMELRYLGTRGVHLLTQNRINRQPKASPAIGGLPTFLSAPSQAQLDALSLTLDDIDARSNYVPAFEQANFLANLVGFLSNGNSTYHGASAQLTRRLSRGFQASAAYTWSHLIDDTTAEVFSTVLSPRRVEDFQNLRAERADSALDRRHRFVFAGLYELPFLRESQNRFARAVIGGWSFAGTLTFESGQRATVLSGLDSNLNGDAAGDRAIRNTAGVRNTASTVSALTNSGGHIVGYLADNPNAEYIMAGEGAVSNSARNTLQLPGINNLDFSIFKNFRFGETRRVQLRADLFNAFNHAQYIPGSVNNVDPIATIGVGQVNTIFPATGDLNRPQNVFSSNPRVIQMALRIDF